MGKGGNAVSVLNNAVKSIDKESIKLDNERKEKIANAPKFYWASEGALEEPHVAR